MSDPNPAVTESPASQAPPDLLRSARENLEQLNELRDREEAAVTPLQAGIEAVSKFFGSPAYLVFVVLFIVGWVTVNSWGAHAGWAHYDEPPFVWLQGLVSANALLLTIAVLIRQSRMVKQSTRRAHLDLHINLLTEEKVSKVLEVVHQLAKALGKEIHDEDEIKELATASDPHAMLTAIKDSERDAKVAGSEEIATSNVRARP